jgi:DUF4097 and DUF4098 domain-containing protein YvlB
MRNYLAMPALAAGLLCLTACEVDLGDFERVNRSFHYNYPLTADGRLEVETFNGSVEISTWERAEVDISGTKYGPSAQAADALQVGVDHSANAVSIRVTRPSNVRGNRGASLVIKVPRGATLDRVITSNGAIRTAGGIGPARLRTSNAAVRVDGLRGPLDVESSNGSLELLDIDGAVTGHTSNSRIKVERARGAAAPPSERPVRLETSNGSVDVRLEEDALADLRVTTSNASITVRLAGDPSARLVARTSNGKIESDFSLRTRGEIGKNRLEGELGSGGPLMDLTTSNGGIHLVR